MRYVEVKGISSAIVEEKWSVVGLEGTLSAIEILGESWTTLLFDEEGKRWSTWLSEGEDGVVKEGKNIKEMSDCGSGKGVRDFEDNK